jgi:hypothetical protein
MLMVMVCEVSLWCVGWDEGGEVGAPPPLSKLAKVLARVESSKWRTIRVGAIRRSVS